MSERYRLSSRADLSMRKAYDKDFQAELRRLTKGSGWTKYQSSVVRSDRQWFVAANFMLLWPTRRASFDVSVKPMALDPQLWRIMRIKDFERLSLSHRDSGAFVCRVPPLANCAIPLENPNADARSFIEFATSQWPRIISLIEETNFTDLLGYINLHMEFGRYTTSYLISLLQDGRYREIVQHEVRVGQSGVTFQNIVADGNEYRSEDVIDLIKAEAVRLSKVRH